MAPPVPTSEGVTHKVSIAQYVGDNIRVFPPPPPTCLYTRIIHHVCLLFYAIATLFQLYHGGDMMNEMRKRKPEPTILTTQGIFNLPQHIDIV